MIKPSKKFFRLWPYHVRDLGVNAVTFVLSMARRGRQPDYKMIKELHWHEDNSAAGPSSFAGDSITVLSWNVFKGFYEHKLISIMHDIIREHEPDIIAFQEAPMYPDGSFLEWPEDFPPASMIYISSQKKRPGVYEFEHTGELTASRMPHQQAQFHLFPKVTNQIVFSDLEYLHRNFLYSKWRTKRGTLGLYNVHMESVATPLNRLVEVQALYDVIEKNDDDITVVAGDFNTIMGATLEPAVQFFRKKGFVNGLRPGLPQWVPRLDHIFVRGAKSIKTTILPRLGSDHKPAIAKIEL